MVEAWLVCCRALSSQSFAVLFDTFVVRSFLVPAIMDLLGEVNWWPTKFPPPVHQTLHDIMTTVSMRRVRRFSGAGAHSVRQCHVHFMGGGGCETTWKRNNASMFAHDSVVSFVLNRCVCDCSDRHFATAVTGTSTGPLHCAGIATMYQIGYLVY